MPPSTSRSLRRPFSLWERNTTGAGFTPFILCMYLMGRKQIFWENKDQQLDNKPAGFLATGHNQLIVFETNPPRFQLTHWPDPRGLKEWRWCLGVHRYLIEIPEWKQTTPLHKIHLRNLWFGVNIEVVTNVTLFGGEFYWKEKPYRGHST